VALETAELLADLPLVLDLLSAMKDALAATKGVAPVERDFAILEAVLPKLKALVLQVDSQIKS
jgi:hypothetical protein